MNLVERKLNRMSSKCMCKEEVAWQQNRKSNAGLLSFVAFNKTSGFCTLSGASSAEPFSNGLSAFPHLF